MDKDKESRMLIPYYPTKEHHRPLLVGRKWDIDKSIIDNIDTDIVLLDKDMNITLMNKAAEKTWGIDFKEAKGKNYLSLKSSSMKNELSDDLHEVIENQKIVNKREVRYLSPNNTAHFIDFNYIPVIDENGKVEGILSFGKDVTKYVNQEIIKQETDERLKELLHQLSKKDKQINQLKGELHERYKFHNLIGKDPAMINIYNLIERIAPTDSTVLITGETGVGKELVAKAIHYNSLRKDNDLISINCASLPETLLESELFGHVRGSFTGAIKDRRGKFELAHRGTIFLDEIAEMSFATQAKLLRVIQEREIERIGDERKIKVDIRIIAATNQDLSELINSKGFRKDLYYRLNVISIKIPPLKDRIDDVPLLAKHFIDKFNKKYGKNIARISPQAQKMLLGNSWPGNVRELEATLEKAVILCESNVIDLADLYDMNAPSETQFLLNQQPTLPEELSSYNAIKEQLDQYEKIYFLSIFKKFRGRINDIAEFTGLNRRTILNKIKKFNIEKRDFK